jgi:hypothetical protein
MPEEGRSTDPAALAAVRPARRRSSFVSDTELSTLLFAPEVASAAADDEVRFRDLWHVILKRKWSIIAFFLIAVTATAIGTLMQTPVYRAEITLRIDSEASKIMPFKDGVQFDTGDPDYFSTAARAPEEPCARRAGRLADEAEAGRRDDTAAAAVVGGIVPQGGAAGAARFAR